MPAIRASNRNHANVTMQNSELVEQINDAIGAHGMWKMRLRTSINSGKSDVTSAIASCDDQCNFGKWLQGRGITEDLRAGMPYTVVKRLHAEFHRSAGTVLRHVERGEAEAAQAALEAEFTDRSEILVRALNKWKRELFGIAA